MKLPKWLLVVRNLGFLDTAAFRDNHQRLSQTACSDGRASRLESHVDLWHSFSLITATLVVQRSSSVGLWSTTEHSFC